MLRFICILALAALSLCVCLQQSSPERLYLRLLGGCPSENQGPVVRNQRPKEVLSSVSEEEALKKTLRAEMKELQDQIYQMGSNLSASDRSTLWKRITLKEEQITEMCKQQTMRLKVWDRICVTHI